METSTNLGSSVDPPRQIEYAMIILKRSLRKHFNIMHENLSEDLLLKMLMANNTECSLKEMKELVDEVKRLKQTEDSSKKETGRDFKETRFGSYNNPDSYSSDILREKLKDEVGDDFTEIAYKVINMIPDPDWNEFARTALKVEERVEQSIKVSGRPTTDMKYDMIKNWHISRKQKGQDASGKALLDLAINFLTKKGLVSKIVQQHFETVHTQTFNAFCVNNQGPPMQTPA